MGRTVKTFTLLPGGHFFEGLDPNDPGNVRLRWLAAAQNLYAERARAVDPLGRVWGLVNEEIRVISTVQD